MSDRTELTLEKMEIKKKLDLLEKSVVNLDKSVINITTVLFGEQGGEGVVQQLNNLLKVAKVVETIAWKSFLGIMAIIGLGTLPYITDLINKIIQAHHG